MQKTFRPYVATRSAIARRSWPCPSNTSEVLRERNLRCLGAGSARSPGRESVGTTSVGPDTGLRGFPTGGRGAQVKSFRSRVKTLG